MEHQQVEWKESWRDEYLKWICGFANAQGGMLHIGRSDRGAVVGLAKPEKLLEDIPNKIRNSMGIICDITLSEEKGKPYIIIRVPPYPSPISLRGQYYYRTGSTLQELSGNALDEFMLRKQGKTWDGVPIPYVKPSDLDIVAFREFRKKAIASTRLNDEDVLIADELLLENLMLVEGSYLKRAALLLFHENPEKWVPGAYVKIGYFENAADLLHQDEIHGPLLTMPDRVVETAYLKYFKGIISYEGLQRIETYPVPRAAFREAVLNAIVHKDYSTGNPIHIHIYPDEVLIYNDGKLPDTWTVSDLFEKHTSIPHNPLIAGAFFRSGLIEAWGRGIEKITSACKEAGKPEPFYKVRPNEVMIGFNTEANDDIGIVENIVDSIVEKHDLSEMQAKILAILQKSPKSSAAKIAAAVGIAPRNVQTHLQTLKDRGLIERVGPAKGGHWVVK